MRLPPHATVVFLLLGLALAAPPRRLAAEPTPPLAPDIPAKFAPPVQAAEFERREVMIAMRDGVKLHTVILVPRGARRAPIVLTRTPYNASKRAERTPSNRLAAVLPVSDDQIALDRGYIRAFQDVRGKFGSEGDYVMTRPLRGPLNASAVDHSTDAYDTIDWLVKNVPETNGKVAMVGSSYEGFTVLMALVHPHPALKAAIPMCPMVDGWRGDDWFHNGAFRQTNFDYFFHQTTERAEGKPVPRQGYDDYDNFRRAGSAGDFARANGLDQVGFWRKLSEHPAYDAFWQGQALDRLLAAEPLTVPTMIVASIWDQEDSYGGVTTYRALEPKDTANDRLFLVLGPWRHSGANYDATSLGPLRFDSDTALAFRRDIAKPFLDAHLKERAPRAGVAPVNVYETGTNAWRRLPRWPLACPTGCPAPLRPLYLQPGGRAGFAAPTAEGFDEYVSDPAKPVPYLPRPVRFADADAWRSWLVSDQRTVADRPDVVGYVSDPLPQPIHIAGAPQVNLHASTSGTDSDWVVKLIDVYPDEVPAQPELGGYQLGVAMDIFRGRYRDSFEHPTAIPAGTIQRYRFLLPTVDHVFLPGHRIMVQVQSSWFPLYDRNPQTFVENIFFARPGDYRKATQRVYHQPGAATSIELPVAP
ncbi:MAG TPA: CocE/NonD family hydrolase [Kofleriaceae bacterium]|nr:CocE/NonD family hydrolase [Kofleriaceae bacterium]